MYSQLATMVISVSTTQTKSIAGAIILCFSQARDSSLKVLSLWSFIDKLSVRFNLKSDNQ
jgi:hypothetical protein